MQAYCAACHAAYMRRNRPKFAELEGDARKRAVCRSYTKNLIRRGELQREPCRDCGDEKSEVHHPDYDDPRNVVWLCRTCHLSLHRNESVGDSAASLGRT